MIMWLPSLLIRQTNLEPFNVQIQFGKVQANAMIDPGSVLSLITKMLANKILRTTPSANRVTTKKNKGLKTFQMNELECLDTPQQW